MRAHLMWRYRNDAQFHKTVRVMAELMRAGIMKPQDLREALECAEGMFERREPDIEITESEAGLEHE